MVGTQGKRSSSVLKDGQVSVKTQLLQRQGVVVAAHAASLTHVAALKCNSPDSHHVSGSHIGGQPKWQIQAVAFLQVGMFTALVQSPATAVDLGP